MSTLPLKWLLHPQTSNLKWWQSTLPVGQSGNLGTNLDSAPSYAYPIQQQFLLGRLSIYIRSVTTSPHLHYQHLGLSRCHLTWIITRISPGLHSLTPPLPSTVCSQHYSQIGTCEISDDIASLFCTSQLPSISFFITFLKIRVKCT